MQEPRIETKPPRPIMGLHARFVSGLAADTNAPDVIGPLWGRFHPRLGEIPAVDPTVFYGYCWFGPGPRTRPDELDYVAGVEVAPGAKPPEGMVTVEMAGGLYAVFEHHGPITRFDETLSSIYRAWLPHSDYEGNGIGDVERYHVSWAHDAEDAVFEYWVGVRPKA